MLDRLTGSSAGLNLTTMSLSLTCWPETPDAPGQGAVAVIRVPQVAPRSELGLLARACVLRILGSWGFTSASFLETATGPRLAGCGELALSLAYTPDCAWIALAKGRSVGIDATAIGDFAELREVAHAYLGPASADIAAAAEPAEAFAAAWSRHEATLKYHRLRLTEWRTGMPPAPRHLAVRTAGISLSVVLDA